MAKAAKPGRPTNTMMKAVNLNLEGKEDEAKELLKSQPSKQHTEANLKRFTAARKDKGPYEIGGAKAGAKRGRKAAPQRRGRGRAQTQRQAEPDIISFHDEPNVLGMIDGRTKIATLVKLEAKIQSLLAGKDKKEVEAKRKAAKQLEDLKKQVAEAEALLK